MFFLSTITSFWYSLNSSYDHGFHLSQVAMAMATAMAVMATPPTVAVAAMVKAVKTTIN